MFFQMPDGSYMAPGYGDNRVGTVMMGVQGDKKVKGWGVMNGTNNAKAIGGSGIDAGDKFLRQWTSQAQNKTTGGSATGALDLAVTIASGGSGTSGTSGAHTHTAASGGAHTHSTDSQGGHTHTAASTTLATHGTHAHGVTLDYSHQEGTGGPTQVMAVSETNLSAELVHASHTHTIGTTGAHTHTAASGGAHTHSTDDPGTHTHTTPAHAHSASVAAGGGGGATAATIPPFLYVAMLERLNNSGPR